MLVKSSRRLKGIAQEELGETLEELRALITKFAQSQTAPANATPAAPASSCAFG